MMENNRVEFKRELNDRFERSVVSFLNYAGGGEIVIGVDDSGEVFGVTDADSVQLKVIDRIRNNIKPQTLGLFDVVLEQRGGRDVIRVIVSCGQQRPYYIRKYGMTEQGCFIRVGSSSQPMSESMIDELINKRRRASLQAMDSPSRNLTFKQLRIHYDEKNFEATEQFIESLDLKKSDGGFNYAAYLLADTNGMSVQVAVYAGTDKVDLSELREYGNRCLVTATKGILDRLDSENRTYAKITSIRRLEKERVNSIALREAVINAVVHNDYTMGNPLVEIFSDRIVVTSCGGLVEGLTEEDFFKCRSMPRNRELMRVFRDIELVEQIGSGMSKILKVYDRSIFELTPSFTVVTFPFEKGFILEGETNSGGNDRVYEKNDDRVYGETNGKMNGEIAGSKNDKINRENGGKCQKNDKINRKGDKRSRKNDEIIITLTIMKEDPDVTIPRLSDLTGKSESTISREIKTAKNAGLLRRKGARKNGRWVVE
ncbi:MAG: putative DNA binding domain-containing protein [Methanimicrococcus sp.]|nr:putative DNA binding domain-containing protein [Methanimicrococcus sp.]